MLIYFFISCLFPKERQKRGMELDGGENLEGDEGKGDCDLNILYERVFIFIKKITFLNMIKKKITKLNLYKNTLEKMVLGLALSDRALTNMREALK